MLGELNCSRSRAKGVLIRQADIRKCMFTYIYTPSEGGYAGAHDMVLVDSDNFMVGEDLEGFLAC